MTLPELHTYTIRIKDGKVTPAPPNSKPVRTFTAPVTQKKLPKLYIIKKNNEILYVGATVQSISTRLRYGLKAAGEQGYYGYQWKNRTEELQLLIWCFENLIYEDEKEYKENIKKIEAIEAEVVFLYRQKRGKWPEAQTEIHFHNDEESRKIAEEIYNRAVK